VDERLASVLCDVEIDAGTVPDVADVTSQVLSLLRRA
jgi:hypothetical protein